MKRWLQQLCCAVPLLLVEAAGLRAQESPAQLAGRESEACEELYAAKQYPQAADCFAQVAARVADRPEVSAAALLMQGKSLLHTSKPERAETALRSSIQMVPRAAEAFYLLGHLLQQQNRAKESLELYTRAAALHPPTGEDLRIVGLDYVLLGSYRDALYWLQRAVAFSPEDAEAWYDLGRVQMHDGRFAEAATAFEKSLGIQPRSAKAEDNLGVCLEAQNQPDAALAAYARAVAVAQSEPNPSEQPYLDYGKLLNTRNGFQQALPLLKRATELNPKNSSAFAELSRAYSGLGAPDDARSAMERAVSLDRTNSRLHYQLARLYRAAGMPAQASREFDLSAKLYGQKSAE